MTDNEKIILIMKYSANVDYLYRNEYIDELNNYVKSFSSRPEDVLELYRKKIRYEAFKEFSGNLDKILYSR